MLALLNQRVEHQPVKTLIGGILLHRDSVSVGVNHEGLCCVAIGTLYYPRDGNLLASDTRMYPIKEILRKLEKDFGSKYNLVDYQPPLKPRYVMLAEFSALSLRELNEILERLQRQLEARCYCPGHEKDYAQASQVCQPLSMGVRRRSKGVDDTSFLISNFNSIMEEPERVKVLDNCKRLMNKDHDLVLAAAVGIYPLEQHDFTRDPVSRSQIESREKELGCSYA